MRIAILGIKGVPGHHGVEVVVDSLLPHLVSMGHEITVYGYESYTQITDDYLGARVLAIKGSKNKNFEMFSHMWNASMDARRRNFDIIHIHSTDPCILAWMQKPKIGLVATSHGQAYLRKKWGLAAKVMSKLAERFFIHVPDVRTSVSRPLCDYYESRYGKKVVYIPNGIDFRGAPDASMLERWGLTPGEFIFCSSGRIERTKGLSTLLDAYITANPGMPLVVAGGGSGSDTAYMEELKERNVEGVIFAGFLTGDELFALYAHAGVFVFPSEYEAMSMALLEGLSFGVPTVYSDTPENEAVAKGLGYPFKVKDANSLAEKLLYVLNHRQEAAEIGEKARELVRKNHDWSAVARRYNEVYEQLAARKRRGL